MKVEEIEELEAMAVDFRPLLRRLVEERASLLAALCEIQSADHAEDGGPDCGHAYIADAAIKKAEAF